MSEIEIEVSSERSEAVMVPASRIKQDRYLTLTSQ